MLLENNTLSFSYHYLPINADCFYNRKNTFHTFKSLQSWVCATWASPVCLVLQELSIWSPWGQGSFILSHFWSRMEMPFPFEVYNSECVYLLILKAKQKQMNTKERKVCIIIARHKCEPLSLLVSKSSYHLTTPMQGPWKNYCRSFLTSTSSFIYWRSCMSRPGLSTWGRGN